MTFKETASEKCIMLSHGFTHPVVKGLALFVSGMVGVSLCLFLVKNYFEDLVVSGIIIIYLILSLIYDVFLVRSRVVCFNDKYLIIQKRKHKVSIALDRIYGIKRKFWFFYGIRFRDHSDVRDIVVVFITPNPTLKEPVKIRLLKKYSGQLFMNKKGVE